MGNPGTHIGQFLPGQSGQLVLNVDVGLYSVAEILDRLKILGRIEGIRDRLEQI